MIIFTEIRIKRHIPEHVIHPAHIPFIVKAETAVLRRLSNHRPSRGFFRYHQNLRIGAECSGIELPQKFHRFQILPSAVYIRYPFAALPAVV